MKLSLVACAVALCYVVSVVRADNADDVMAEWSPDQNPESEMLPALIRNERATKDTNTKVNKNKNKKAKGDNCKYVKGAWGDCDPKTNLRVRTLTLKKGDATSCEATKTIQKKCKKGKQSCQYDKGAWSACTTQGTMARTDRLKAGSDSNCEGSRQVTRPCKNKQGGANNKQAKGGSSGTGRRNKQ